MGLPAQKPSIDNCHACGKLFPRSSVQLCSGCVMIDENRFELVRAFLDDHNGAPLLQIARGTGLGVSDVRAFLEGGRLVHRPAADACTCGGVGTRCTACRNKLAGPLRELQQAMQQEQAAGSSAGPEAAGRTSYVRRIHRSGD